MRSFCKNDATLFFRQHPPPICAENRRRTVNGSASARDTRRRYRFGNSYEASVGYPLCAGLYTHIYTHTGRTVRSLPYKSQFNLHSFFVRSEASLPPLECYPIEKDLKQYKLNSCSFFCATWVTVRDRFRCACYVLSSGALKMRRWIADFEIYLVLGRLWALTATTTAKKKWHVFFYPFVCFIRFALVAHIVPIVDSRLFEFNRSRNDFSDEGNYFQRWFASS